MSKIRDLAINAIPADPSAEAGANAAEYMMNCPQATVLPPQEPPKPQCKPSPPPPKSASAGGVPHDAVVRMKQQLRQRVRTHVHD